jgi:N-acetylgalactosamine kinase
MTIDEIYSRVVAEHRAAFSYDGDVRIARAPGRVNVIGEHTDYNGLSVLPTAIDREIAIAFSESDSSDVELTNLDPRFGARRFSVSGEITPFEPGDWGNYAKAAAQAIWKWAEEFSPGSLPLKGFRGCAGGTIPPGSGLSSSSAMVVAVAFALMSVNDLSIDPLELASLLAKGERYVGTQGGGMDQAASILSRRGCVLKISFNPLKVQPITLPGECAFVIANSMVHADKAGSAKTAYNTRVVECRLGLEMLKTMSINDWPEVASAVSLGDVMACVGDWRSLVDELPEGGLSLASISVFCGLDESEVRDRLLRSRDGSYLDEPTGGFEIKRRCRHVLTEGARVDLAASAMSEGRLDDLGRLMNESHESCASDYEVSCKELDELVSILRRHGALGARLTGAGFGGCTVAAVRTEQADELVQGVARDYYEGYLADKDFRSKKDISSFVFQCVPSSGAGIL